MAAAAAASGALGGEVSLVAALAPLCRVVVLSVEEILGGERGERDGRGEADGRRGLVRGVGDGERAGRLGLSVGGNADLGEQGCHVDACVHQDVADCEGDGGEGDRGHQVGGAVLGQKDLGVDFAFLVL